MFRNEFIKYEGHLYILKKKVKAEYNPNIEAWKWWTGSDVALKKDEWIYFVELVPDLDIEEIN